MENWEHSLIISMFFREMKENHLLILTLVAVGIGLGSGLLLRHFELSDDVRNLVGFPGEIFMQVLKLMILPLIFSSLISCKSSLWYYSFPVLTVTALGQMDAERSGKMGLMAVSYYLTTVLIASAIGVTIVLLIHPGDPAVKNKDLDDDSNENNLSALDTILDLIRNMFPENIVEATMKRSQTTFVIVKKNVVKNGTVNGPDPVMKKAVQLSAGTNILGLSSEFPFLKRKVQGW